LVSDSQKVPEKKMEYIEVHNFIPVTELQSIEASNVVSDSGFQKVENMLDKINSDQNIRFERNHSSDHVISENLSTNRNEEIEKKEVRNSLNHVSNKSKKKKKKKNTCVSEDQYSSLLSDEYCSDAEASRRMVAKYLTKPTNRRKNRQKKMKNNLTVIRALKMKNKIMKKKFGKRDVDFVPYIIQLMADDYRRLKIQTSSSSLNSGNGVFHLAGDISHRRPSSSPPGTAILSSATSGSVMTSSSVLPSPVIAATDVDDDGDIELSANTDNTSIPNFNKRMEKGGPESIFSPNRLAAKRRGQGGPKLVQAQFCLNDQDFPPIKAHSKIARKFVLNPRCNHVSKY
jgi:hypothetical protein